MFLPHPLALLTLLSVSLSFFVPITNTQHLLKKHKTKQNPFGAEEMVQQLRVPTALAEDPSLVPRTHVKCLTITYNSSSKEINALSSMGIWRTLAYTYTY